MNNFIANIHHAIFDPFRAWAEQSTGNWNILIGIGFLVLMGSLILLYVSYKKMGESDERTNQLSLKSCYWMLLAIILCDIIFPKEYMWTIFFLFKYSLAFLAGGLYLAIQYKRDFA